MSNPVTKNLIRPITKGIDTLVDKTNVLHVYDNITSDTVENLLSRDQLSLFNGFDEIGGAITKYDDAANWYKDSEYKYETMVLAIIILDKPSAWLFSGIGNGVVKKINEDIEKVSKLQYLARKVNDSKSEDCTNFKYEVKNSKYLELISDFEFKVLAETRTCLDKMLMRSMSTFSDTELESMDNEQLNKMSVSRSQWKDCFKLANVSRMKRVAMMYLELSPSVNLIKNARRWIKNHGGRFVRQTRLGPNPESIRIMKESVKEFRKDKNLWLKHKKLFSQRLRQDVVPLEMMDYEYIPSATGQKFVDMCNRHIKIEHLSNKFNSDGTSDDNANDVDDNDANETDNDVDDKDDGCDDDIEGIDYDADGLNAKVIEKPKSATV